MTKYTADSTGTTPILKTYNGLESLINLSLVEIDKFIQSYVHSFLNSNNTSPTDGKIGNVTIGTTTGCSVPEFPLTIYVHHCVSVNGGHQQFGSDSNNPWAWQFPRCTVAEGFSFPISTSEQSTLEMGFEPLEIGDGSGAIGTWGNVSLPQASVRVINVTNGGTGFTQATAGVTISAPVSGTTATARAIVTGGSITAIEITNGGLGYLTNPTVTFTGGTGATAEAFVF
jgi:hypothetical protein